MSSKKQLTEAERSLIFKLKNQGKLQKDIAELLSVSARCISYVLKNYTKEDCT